jgi:DNA-binding transcriptional MerR regulator
MCELAPKNEPEPHRAVASAVLRVRSGLRRDRPHRAHDYRDAYVNVNLVPDKLRIGSFAALTGTTPRTIRYYEEIGLLPCPGEREQGKHRCYTQADAERVREIVRLRDLLGLSLEQLSQLIAGGDPRAELLQRVRTRRRELAELERQLLER